MMWQPPAAETGDIAFLCRAFLAIVLGLAAWAKLRDRGGFRAVLRFLMPRAPAAAIASLAAAVVGFEALLAGMLVAGFRTDVAAWGTVGFLFAATATLLVLRRRGYQGGCACFGDHAAAGPPGLPDLARNAVLTTVSLAVAQSSAAPPLWEFPAATVALAVATTVGVLLSFGMVAAVVAMRAAGAPTPSEHAAAALAAPGGDGGREG